MTFHATIDLGQLIISGFICALTIIGWFIKQELTETRERLKDHEEVIHNLAQIMQYIMGFLNIPKPPSLT